MDRPVLRGQPGEASGDREQAGSAPSDEPRWLSRLVLRVEGKDASTKIHSIAKCTSGALTTSRADSLCLSERHVVTDCAHHVDATQFIGSPQESLEARRYQAPRYSRDDGSISMATRAMRAFVCVFSEDLFPSVSIDLFFRWNPTH
jgi:hypothetical protein